MSMTMKKLTILILLVAASIASKSQSNLPYKPLSAFSNDTTAFMIYNFMDRADAYIGKTIKDVEKDLGMPITEYNYFTESGSDIIIGLYIYIYNSRRLEYLKIKKLDYSGLKIYFDRSKSNARDKEIKTLRRKSKYWKNGMKEICKDFKISDISVQIPEKSKYYKKYKTKVLKSASDDSEFTPFIIETFVEDK